MGGSTIWVLVALQVDPLVRDFALSTWLEHFFRPMSPGLMSMLLLGSNFKFEKTKKGIRYIYRLLCNLHCTFTNIFYFGPHVVQERQGGHAFNP